MPPSWGVYSPGIYLSGSIPFPPVPAAFFPVTALPQAPSLNSYSNNNLFWYDNAKWGNRHFLAQNNATNPGPTIFLTGPWPSSYWMSNWQDTTLMRDSGNGDWLVTYSSNVYPHAITSAGYDVFYGRLDPPANFIFRCPSGQFRPYAPNIFTLDSFDNNRQYWVSPSSGVWTPLQPSGQQIIIYPTCWQSETLQSAPAAGLANFLVPSWFAVNRTACGDLTNTKGILHSTLQSSHPALDGLVVPMYLTDLFDYSLSSFTDSLTPVTWVGQVSLGPIYGVGGSPSGVYSSQYRFMQVFTMSKNNPPKVTYYVEAFGACASGTVCDYAHTQGYALWNISTNIGSTLGCNPLNVDCGTGVLVSLGASYGNVPNIFNGVTVHSQVTL
jgi:hypothetical protein